jgi:hypothetical protein
MSDQAEPTATTCLVRVPKVSSWISKLPPVIAAWLTSSKRAVPFLPSSWGDPDTDFVCTASGPHEALVVWRNRSSDLVSIKSVVMQIDGYDSIGAPASAPLPPLSKVEMIVRFPPEVHLKTGSSMMHQDGPTGFLRDGMAIGYEITFGGAIRGTGEMTGAAPGITCEPRASGPKIALVNSYARIFEIRNIVLREAGKSALVQKNATLIKPGATLPIPPQKGIPHSPDVYEVELTAEIRLLPNRTWRKASWGANKDRHGGYGTSGPG